MAGSDICILFLTVSVMIVLEGHFHCLYINKILSFLDGSVLIRVPRGRQPRWFLTGPLLKQNHLKMIIFLILWEILSA